MRRLFQRILCSLVLLALPGCAPLRSVPQASPEERLNVGLSAWRAGDYGRAALELSQLATDPPAPEFGERARLFLLALELDPRNAARESSNGTAIAAELLSNPTVSGTAESLGAVLYLLARDLGATAPADTSRLPQLPGTPLATRFDKLQQERDQQRQEIARLQQSLKQKDEEIQKLTKELERIRSTLRN
jgi:hypothetical protein